MSERILILKTVNDKSMYTVNIYLNGDNDFIGGSTRFYQSRKEKRRSGNDNDILEASVTPSPGRCVVFRQPSSADYLHDGEEVREGIKYLLRTDVMYHRNDNREYYNDDEEK